MEPITAALIGAGALLVMLSFVAGVVELSTLRSIRPPEQKSFTYIRLAANQYQTLVVPAMGALISGLFVSISASFFYEGLTVHSDSWRQSAGSAMFIAGAVALAATLRAVLKGVGEPSELARDPFAIRAAAEEYASNPRRGTLEPSFLEQRMDEWRKFISTRSMNITADKSSRTLDVVLANASGQRTFWRSVIASVHVYFVAFIRFPFRLGWPFLGFVLLTVGIIWFAVGEFGPRFTQSWGPIVAIAILTAPSAVVTLFYCATRGNRARLWHRINLVAVDDARKAIDAAAEARDAVKAEDAVLQRVLERADMFLQDEPVAHGRPRAALLLGCIRITISSTKSRQRSRR